MIGKIMFEIFNVIWDIVKVMIGFGATIFIYEVIKQYNKVRRYKKRLQQKYPDQEINEEQK